MEKRCYEWNYFFDYIIPKLPIIGEGFESKVYKSSEEIWKIFYYTFCDRNEKNIEAIGSLNGDYLTVPHALFYLNNEYFGYAMRDAGCDLEKMIVTKDLSRETILDILEQLREIIDYLHSLSLSHGDIKFDNILVQDGHVRLGDINNLIYPNTATNLNVLHSLWYDTWKSYSLVDIFAFNYLTFLLLNYSSSELREFIENNTVFLSMRTLNELASNNKIVDEKVWQYVWGLLNGSILEAKKSYLKPDILLLDYLK